VKIGFIISMYDEIDIVTNTINTLKTNNLPIIVIQSDPQQSKKLLDSHLVNFYEKLPDLAGSKEEYLKERDVGSPLTATKAIIRNLKAGFTVTSNYDVDWWITILGDVYISNMSDIEKIIKKIISKNKSMGIIRAVGQVFLDNTNQFTRIQKNDTTDFMPQFFITHSSLIKKGLFSKFELTNPYTTEQCIGDEVNSFCVENKINFKDLVYIISDYAYPQFISGLEYNPDRIIMPRYIDGLVNLLRRFKMRFY
tara:strand:- start:262 stop:1017 length:756 start_codon:yes stop_codon:yes gene_type:complete